MDDVSRDCLKELLNNMYEEFREKSEKTEDPLLEFIEEHRTRIDVMKTLRKLRLQSINKYFEAELQAALTDYQKMKDELLETLKCKLEYNIYKLEKEHAEYQKGSKGRQLKYYRKRRGENNRRVKRPLRKAKTVITGPHIVYMLREEEIEDDLTTLQKAQDLKTYYSIRKSYDEFNMS